MTAVIPLRACPGFSAFELPAEPDWREHRASLRWRCSKGFRAFSRGDRAAEHHLLFRRWLSGGYGAQRSSETETWGSQGGSLS
jgi:hypothetical protein